MTIDYQLLIDTLAPMFGAAFGVAFVLGFGAKLVNVFLDLSLGGREIKL